MCTKPNSFIAYYRVQLTRSLGGIGRTIRSPQLARPPLVCSTRHIMNAAATCADTSRQLPRKLSHRQAITSCATGPVSATWHNIAPPTLSYST
jgi:hypothetical protein